jgi:pyruvate/2-oxoacid:ferredoxin oxidoreductase beta subunit
MEIMAAHYNPYSATATIGFPRDLQEKITKAKSIRGTKFIHMLVPCPTGWKTPSDLSPELSILAVETNVFPLFEVEDGTKYTINRESRHLPVQEYLMKQGRYRHLKEEQIKQIQTDVDEEWERLKQRAEHSAEIGKQDNPASSPLSEKSGRLEAEGGCLPVGREGI